MKTQPEESGWMRQLCSDEQERRLFAATENTVIVWSILSGELKLRLT